MRFRTVLLFLCVYQAGCSSLTPSWDVHSRQEYRLTNEPSTMELHANPEQLLHDPVLLQQAIDKLNEINIKPELFPINVTLEPVNGTELQVLAVNRIVEYQAPPEDETEKARRELHQKQAGLVQLNTIINEKGENQNSFLKQQQANLVAFLFQLPAEKIQPGAEWQLPVTLTSLSTAFIADRTHRINRVWVHSISNQSDNAQVAEFVYLIYEHIKGVQQQLITDPPIPFIAQASYFAVGKFEINKKQWLRYTGRLETSLGNFKDVNLIALLPVTGESK